MDKASVQENRRCETTGKIRTQGETRREVVERRATCKQEVQAGVAAISWDKLTSV